MAGLNLGDLPLPPRPFRVDTRTTNRKSGVRFETEEASKKEDLRRASGLQRTIAKGLLDPDEVSRARRLQSELALAAKTGIVCDTLASAMAMRCLRIIIAGHLWKLMRSRCKYTTATVIPRSWEFTPEELAGVDPRSLMAAFRTALYKAGIQQVSGWLFAYLHGEYDPLAGVFRLHLHIAMTKSMEPVLDRLRLQPNYRSTRYLDDGSPSPVFRRVWIRRKPLTSMPDPVTYVLQSFWPARPIYFDEDGKRHRLRQKGAIREPVHSLVLLWLDRWKVQDLTLMVGLRVTRAGLTPTQTHR